MNLLASLRAEARIRRSQSWRKWMRSLAAKIFKDDPIDFGRAFAEDAVMRSLSDAEILRQNPPKNAYDTMRAAQRKECEKAAAKVFNGDQQEKCQQTKRSYSTSPNRSAAVPGIQS